MIFLQVLVLFGFSMVGNWLQNLLHLPLPGSIIGLILVWLCLMLKVFPLRWIESGALFFLSYLPLFYIPAAIGIMNYGQVFIGKGVLLVIIAIFSTFLTMWLSAWTSQWIARQSEKKKGPTPCK
ncbi:hypothetical protein AU377_06815 [Sporosarcina sp. HYO08]|nr:hypothetical protein AU377_06815 [Sporosarcina sp. HYO08]